MADKPKNPDQTAAEEEYYWTIIEPDRRAKRAREAERLKKRADRAKARAEKSKPVSRAKSKPARPAQPKSRLAAAKKLLSKNPEIHAGRGRGHVISVGKVRSGVKGASRASSEFSRRDRAYRRSL